MAPIEVDVLGLSTLGGHHERQAAVLAAIAVPAVWGGGKQPSIAAVTAAHSDVDSTNARLALRLQATATTASAAAVEYSDADASGAVAIAGCRDASWAAAFFRITPCRISSDRRTLKSYLSSVTEYPIQNADEKDHRDGAVRLSGRDGVDQSSERLRDQLLRDVHSDPCLPLAHFDHVAARHAPADSQSTRQQLLLSAVRSLIEHGLIVVGGIVGGSDERVEPWNMSLDVAMARIHDEYVVHHDDQNWVFGIWFAPTVRGEQAAEALKEADPEP
ncbi:hypothetical protein [Mycolicibacterium stellerae]|uniref:hypothetical protein n=1 Tax=Mycolicibacterium stellerae TaxID=2358193 RepID=UPI0013DDE2ED|nr:hypothetical protein [Mycolicibacterium stellerae]